MPKKLAAFALGNSHCPTSEDDGRTRVARPDSYRPRSTTIFAERGGTAVVTNLAGNVYLASGQVWIYDRTGKETGVRELPNAQAASPSAAATSARS